MSCLPERITLFCNRALLPACWKAEASKGPVWCFNPTLLRQADRWIFAYRVVLPDQRRRIAACLLNDAFEIVDGSQVPVSDTIKFDERPQYSERVTTWFADPRLYAVKGNINLYFNSGWHEPRNHQFVVALDENLFPTLGPAKEIDLLQPCKSLEKNWVFLADTLGDLVYSPDPHLLAQFVGEQDGRLLYSLLPATQSTPAVCPKEKIYLPEIKPTAELYSNKTYLVRGGAPPVRRGSFYYSFCHAISTNEELPSYRACVYRFSALAPYALVDQTYSMLEVSLPKESTRTHPPLNPAVAEVVYPCGAALLGKSWHVACGLNDERCAIVTFDSEKLEASLGVV